MNLINKNRKDFRIDADVDFTSNESIEESYEKNEMKSLVQECMSKMNVIYREPLSLYYLEDKSYGEICDILKIAPGTVATRINRAKVIMRKLCQTKIK